jgi:hypothetical protein
MVADEKKVVKKVERRPKPVRPALQFRMSQAVYDDLVKGAAKRKTSVAEEAHRRLERYRSFQTIFERFSLTSHGGILHTAPPLSPEIERAIEETVVRAVEIAIQRLKQADEAKEQTEK